MLEFILPGDGDDDDDEQGQNQRLERPHIQF